MNARGVFLLATITVLLTPAHAAWPQVVTQEIVQAVWVHDVPGPTGETFWDGVVVNLFKTFVNPRSIYPDIVVCAKSASGKQMCTEVCEDVELDAHKAPAKSDECRRPLDLALVSGDPRMLLQVLEIDPGRQRIILTVTVKDPAHCLEDQPCTFETPTGPLVVSFLTAVRGGSGTPAPSTPSTTTQSPAPRPAAAPPGNMAAPVARVGEAAWPLVEKKVADERTLSTFKVPGQPFILGTGDRCCVDQNDVKQGGAGNCFLLSSLAAIAGVSPGTIKNAINDHQDGTYDVTLYLVDENKHLVPTVVRRLDSTFPVLTPPWSEQVLRVFGAGRQPTVALYARPGDRDEQVGLELWTMLIEKAYAQMHGGYLAPDFVTGGASSYAMQTITGKMSEGWLVAREPTALGLNAQQANVTISTELQLGKMLSDNLSKPDPRAKHDPPAIVAGTLGDCPTDSYWDRARSWFSSYETPAWVDQKGNPTAEFRCTPPSDLFFQEAGGRFIRNHSYFVRSFDGKNIVLGNPLGEDERVTLAEFLDGFRQLHINRPQILDDCTCK